MAVVNMTLVDMDDNGNGGVFHTAFNATAGTDYTDIYKLPVQPITGIAVFLTGDGVVEFSASPPSVLAAGDGVFYVWDGVARVNDAATAFRFKRATGTVAAGVTVKTLRAS